MNGPNSGLKLAALLELPNAAQAAQVLHSLHTADRLADESPTALLAYLACCITDNESATGLLGMIAAGGEDGQAIVAFLRAGIKMERVVDLRTALGLRK